VNLGEVGEQVNKPTHDNLTEAEKLYKESRANPIAIIAVPPGSSGIDQAHMAAAAIGARQNRGQKTDGDTEAAASASLPLVYAEQKNPPPRPDQHDPKVRRVAVEMILPEVIDWIGHDEFKENQRDEIVENLLLVLGESDGYAAARRLERDRGWTPDEELVDILASLSSVLSGAQRVAVQIWVEASQIKPKLKIGDTVSAPRLKIATGTITKIEEATAEYLVTTPDFRMRYPGALSGGTLVPYELAALAAETQGVAA
jgi:hypothetical protein